MPERLSLSYRGGVLFIVVVPFLATIYAMVQLWNRWVTWNDVLLMVALYVITGMGITVGFHRLLTHKSFETRGWMRALLLVAGSMAAEGGAISWASTHIQHHANSDEDDDPHSPLHGLWHAHVGWLFRKDGHNIQKYGSWLLKDPLVVFIDKTFMLWVVLGFVIPFMIGGWQGLLWGGFVRMFLTHHITWSVNSICHTFGGRLFESGDQSRNNFFVGLFAFGEGWHNNHHAFPRAAFHGMRWWQVDISAYFIRAMKAIGLVWNVWMPSREMQERRLIRRSASTERPTVAVEADA